MQGGVRKPLKLVNFSLNGLAIGDFEWQSIALALLIAMASNFGRRFDMQMNEMRAKALRKKRMIFRESESIDDNELLTRDTVQDLVAEPSLAFGPIQFDSDPLAGRAVESFATINDLVVYYQAKSRICPSMLLKDTRGGCFPSANLAANADDHF